MNCGRSEKEFVQRFLIGRNPKLAVSVARTETSSVCERLCPMVQTFFWPRARVIMSKFRGVSGITY